MAYSEAEQTQMDRRLTIEVINMNNEGANQVINTRTAPLSRPGPFPELMTEAELTAIINDES